MGRRTVAEITVGETVGVKELKEKGNSEMFYLRKWKKGREVSHV